MNDTDDREGAQPQAELLTEPKSWPCEFASDDRIGVVAAVHTAGQGYIVVETRQLFEDPCETISALIHHGAVQTKVLLSMGSARRMTAALLDAVDAVEAREKAQRR